jgi:hypothetical protein
MLALADLTGRFLAHAVWCVSDPEAFIPLLGHEKNGKRGLLRLAGSTLEDSVASGRSWLAANPDSVDRAVLIFDAFLTVGNVKTDALFLRAVEYGEAGPTVEIAVPYKPGGTAEGFRVGSPKVLASEGLEDAWDAFFAQFWIGAKSHGEAATVWAKHLDDSL